MIPSGTPSTLADLPMNITHKATAAAGEYPVVELVLPHGWQIAGIGFCTPGECLRRIEDGVAGEWLFLMHDDVPDFETAVRAAVAEWLATEGWAEQYGPNWGDAIECVPVEVWLKHGLSPLQLDVGASFVVDHDDCFEVA